MLNEEHTFPRNHWYRLTVFAAAVAVAVAGITPAVVQAATAADPGREFYVSPTGDDVSGTGSVDHPWRTMEAARDSVRGLDDDVTVYFRGGRYAVTSTIEFTSADSGTNGHRITYAAYPGEKPVFDAGVPVTEWTQHDGDIWEAPLARADKLRSLYVNDARYTMASTTVESRGCSGQYAVTAGQAPWAWESGTECDGIAYGAGDVPEISRNQTDVEIRTQTTWSTAIAGVREITTSTDGSQRVALLQQPGGAIAEAAAYAPLQTGGSHVLSNAYEFLDQPGEFFFDREAQKVYVYKDDATDLATASVFAPDNVETILSVNGTDRGDRVHDLTFTGLTFAHSDWNLTQIEGSSFKQTQQGNTVNLAFTQQNFHVYTYRNLEVEPGAVEVNSAANIDFVRNRVEHTGAGGIQFVNDVVDSKIEGNVTNDVGGSAVNIGDPQHVYIGDGTATNGEHYAPDVEGAPTNISVRNNYLHDSAVLFWGSAAISGYFLDTVAIDNNRIEKASWAGISMGWGWWNFNGNSDSINPGNPTTVARNNSIQRNEILDTMRFLSDSGPIYTLGDQRGSVIDDNFARGIRPGHTYGLHPDEGSANIAYNDNVIDADPGIAYTLNSGVWGYQHDLQILNTWGPNDKIFDRNVPNSTIQSIKVVQDRVWPAVPQAVSVASGLEPAYRDILDGAQNTADFALPASALATDSMTSIPVRGVGDASLTLWLAPAGTTSFVEGATMSSAAADATSISLPQSHGTYKLYVVESGGVVASESEAAVVRTAPAPRNATLENVAAQKCLDMPGATTQNGARPALWDCHGDPNQRFTFTPESELRIYGDKCLAPQNDGSSAGTAVVIQDCTGSASQKWTLEDDATIVSDASGLCLTIAGGRTDNGGPAEIASCSSATVQKWDFPISEYTQPTGPTPTPTPSPTSTPSPTPSPSLTPTPTGSPTTGEPGSTAPSASLSGSSVQRGGSVRVTVVGLDAGEQVRAELHSDPIAVLGIPAADAAGRVSFDVTIPASFTPGAHTIIVFDATGTEIARLPLTVLAGSALAVTGAQVPWGIALLGALLLVAGTIVAVTRRRRSA